MRKESREEVAQTAQRRLDLLRLELSNAGLAPRALPDGPDQLEEHEHPAQPRPAPSLHPVPAVAEVGRHLRRSDSAVSRVGGWIEDRLPMTLRGRVRIGARELGLLVVLAAVGLVAAALVVLRSGSGGERVPLAAPPLATAGALVSAPPTGVPASPTAATRVTVDVAGKVRHPGVITLPSGARVVDALRRAGGARPRVDLSGLNLARVLTDGEQILVGQAGAPGVAASAAAAAGQPAGGPMVNLNTATEEQLEQLPGVGPVTAGKILTWRSAHGSFSSVDELMEVDGIGEKTLADLAPYVTL